MSLYTEVAKLDERNEEHTKLIIELAKTKAKHDVIRSQFHRKDPKVLETLLAYRSARNAVRAAGDAIDSEREEFEKELTDAE